jgi:hypothetical protein
MENIFSINRNDLADICYVISPAEIYPPVADYGRIQSLERKRQESFCLAVAGTATSPTS